MENFDVFSEIAMYFLNCEPNSSGFIEDYMARLEKQRDRELKRIIALLEPILEECFGR